MNLLLETQRLFLEPVRDDELEILHHIFTDEYVRRYLCDNRIWSVEQVKEMLDESQRLFTEEKFGIWLIKTKCDRQAIGFVCLWYFFDESQAQLGYALLPDATKQGFATEAVLKICEYAFEQLGYEYLIASCDRPNLESQKLAQRIGMIFSEERTINDNPTVFFRLNRGSFTG